MRIDIGASATLRRIVFAMHALAIITLFAFLPAPLAMIGSIGIAWSVLVLHREYISFRTPGAIVVVGYSGSAWQLIAANGAVLRAEIQNSSFVTPLFTMLDFVTELGNRKRVVLLRDNVDADLFRQLRVLLNTHS